MKHFLLLIAAVLTTTSFALAQTCTTQWTGSVSSDFADAQNWSNDVPSAGDVGCIDGPGTNSVDHGAPGGASYGTVVLGGDVGQHTLSIDVHVTFDSLIVRPTGTFDLTSGTLLGSVENLGTMRIAPPNVVLIDAGPPMSNYGRIEVTTGFGLFLLRRTLINEVGGTIAMIGGFSADLAGRAMISSDNDYQIINRGLITSTGGGTGVGENNLMGNIEGGPHGFINEGGRIEVLDARLQIVCTQGCRLEGGEYEAAAEAHLLISGPGGQGYEIEGTLTGDPEGTVELAFGGTMATGAGAAFDFGGEGLTISSISFDGPGWLNAGLLNLQGGLQDATVVNEGVARLTNAVVTINSTWENDEGAVVELTGDHSFGGGGGVTRIANRGRIVKTGGTGASELNGVNNEAGGEVCVETGEIFLILTGDAPGGIYCGNGQINITTTTPHGTISPGLSPGILSIGPTLSLQTMQPSTVLDVEIDGPDPGTGYDRVDFQGAVVLDGQLKARRASGYEPEIGTRFVVLTVPSTSTVTSDFASVDLPNGFSYEINATDVALVVTGPVGIEEGPAGDIPNTFALSSAFPNPFSSSTALALDIAEPGRVVVGVFDALGRSVAVLHDGDLASGTYTLSFEADQLPSGVYIVRATSTGAQQARSVTLVR